MTFEFLAATNLKTTVFWGATPCGLAEIHHSFIKICFASSAVFLQNEAAGSSENIVMVTFYIIMKNYSKSQLKIFNAILKELVLARPQLL